MSIIEKIDDSTRNVNDLYTNILINLLKNIISVIVYAVMLFTLDWRIASVLMIFVPVIGI